MPELRLLGSLKNIVSQNKKDTRQQAADSMSNTARRSNAVYFLFWLTIEKAVRAWGGRRLSGCVGWVVGVWLCHARGFLRVRDYSETK